jgi:hypothetical protein
LAETALLGIRKIREGVNVVCADLLHLRADISVVAERQALNTSGLFPPGGLMKAAKEPYWFPRYLPNISI